MKASIVKNKKGQGGGLITSLVFGVASLVIGVIIAFVIVSTLTDADLLTPDSITVTNETGGFINITGYTLTGASDIGATGFSITEIRNVSNQVVILAGNFTLSSIGVLTNATDTNFASVDIDYGYSRDSGEQISTDSLSANFSSGIDNISTKIPTVLLIAAIILILGTLAVLVGVWQKMRMGGGTSL